jgi:hypothetical protein
MNDSPRSHEHGTHGATGAKPFSDAEWQSLQAADVAAARAVVVLMVSIFLTGVVLYSIVAISVLD